jgi:predicted Rossmann-fold nucleotide-binding protein
VFEVITLKRLGLFLGPIILVNTLGYFDRLDAFLRHAVSERFMAEMHLDMWMTIEDPGQVIRALHEAADWSVDARQFAAVRK